MLQLACTLVYCIGLRTEPYWRGGRGGGTGGSGGVGGGSALMA